MTDHFEPNDPADDELRRRLRTGTRAGGDPAADLRALRPRFERARARRRATVTGLSGAVAAGVVVVVLASGGGGDDQRVQVADVPPPSTSQTTSTAPSSTSATTVVAAPSPTSAVETTTVPAAPPPSTARPGAPTTVGTNPAATAPPVSVPSSADPPPEPSPTTAPVGGRQVLPSDGGTATVVWDATSVVVESTAPAAGWELERVERKDALRVEVRFRRTAGGQGSSTATIVARVVDGRLEVN